MMADPAYKEPEFETPNTETQADELPPTPNTQSSRKLSIVLACLLALALLVSLLLIFAAAAAPAPILTDAFPVLQDRH
jgi:hypothetical protein